MSDDRQQAPRAWLAAGLLGLAMLICTADRTLPGLLMEPIKHAMSLSDFQMGTLTGFTFAISMSIAAVPLAWLADRYDRVMLLTGAMVVWCLMTVGSAFAQDFTSLFVLRLGVGIGEAALMPTALSLLSDLFPMRRVASAMAILAYSSAAGGFAAMAGGGALYGALHAGALNGLLTVEPADAWRWTTAIFGAAGLVVVVLFATLTPEPRRQAPRSTHERTGSDNAFAYLRTIMFFMVPYLACATIFGIFTNGYHVWLAPFFARTYGYDVSEVGRVVGTAALVGTLAGPALGVLYNRFVRARLGRDAPVATICLLLATALPFLVFGPLSGNGLAAAVAVAAVTALTTGGGVVVSVVYVGMAPLRVRARLMAVVHLMVGLLAGTGSVVYASFTDHVVRNPSHLYITMSVLSGVLVAISIAFGVIADRRFERVRAMALRAESAAAA